MKQIIFTFFLFSVLGLLSCRKSTIQPSIKQYDQTQIQNYIAAHGLTGMLRDTVGGDTTGIYYQILKPGISATPIDYPDRIAFVFSLRTLDGSYIQSDTIANHYDGYLGHVSLDKLPLGLQLALHNDLKYPGASMRLLIPSHLAYGVNGYGTGSIQVANSRIGGNASLDYYVNVITDTPPGKPTIGSQAKYDDLVINSYTLANNFTGYTKVQSKLDTGHYYYYKILTPGTGTDVIGDNTTITATYTGQLFNGSIFDGSHNGTNYAALPAGVFIVGVREGLENYATTGTKISLLIPSALAYGESAQTGIPVNSCLRFTWQIVSLTP